MALTAEVPSGRLPDGGPCNHEGETSTYCTRCWMNLYEARINAAEMAERQRPKERPPREKADGPMDTKSPLPSSLTEADKRRIIEEEELRRSLQGKSVGVAIVLSVLIPGLGDLYCRSWVKAGIFAVLNFIVFILILAMGIGFFVAPFVWVAGIISAVMSANASRQRSIEKIERAAGV